MNLTEQARKLIELKEAILAERVERWVSMWVAKIKEWQTRINQGEFDS